MLRFEEKAFVRQPRQGGGDGQGIGAGRRDLSRRAFAAGGKEGQQQEQGRKQAYTGFFRGDSHIENRIAHNLPGRNRV